MRKYIIWGIVALVGIAALGWLIRYLTVGELNVVTSSDSNAISIDKAPAANSEATESTKSTNHIKDANGKVSLSLGAGRYIVSVKGNSVASTQVVEVHAHETTAVTINPVDVTGVEPVATLDADSLGVDATHINFLDPITNVFYQVDSQNSYRIVDGDHRLKEIKWADSNYGVGQGRDGNLYVVNNGSVDLLKGLGDYKNAPSVHFAISPDRTIYVAIGAVVFRGDGGSTFKKIYSASTEQPALSASNTNVAVSVNPGGSTKAKSTPTITIVGEDGKTTKKNIEAYEVTWSPSGKYLLVGNDAGTSIYDSSFQEVATLPNANINNPVWVGDDAVFFSIDDELWSFDMKSQSAKLVANMPLAGAIKGTKVSDDGNYIYLIVEHGYSHDEIKRVGLKGQKTSDEAFRLQSIMPIEKEEYTMRLINFTAPVIYIDPKADTSAQSFAQDAANDLQGRGFDIGKLQFRGVN